MSHTPADSSPEPHLILTHMNLRWKLTSAACFSKSFKRCLNYPPDTKEDLYVERKKGNMTSAQKTGNAAYYTIPKERREFIRTRLKECSCSPAMGGYNVLFHVISISAWFSETSWTTRSNPAERLRRKRNASFATEILLPLWDEVFKSCFSAVFFVY